jgi:hypothetical protein
MDSAWKQEIVVCQLRLLDPGSDGFSDKERANMSIDGRTVLGHGRVFGGFSMPMTAPPAI